MVDTIFVRNVKDRTKKALAWAQNHFGLNEGSKLTVAMLDDYQRLHEQNEERGQRIEELENMLHKIRRAHLTKITAEDDLTRHIANTQTL